MISSLFCDVKKNEGSRYGLHRTIQGNAGWSCSKSQIVPSETVICWTFCRASGTCNCVTRLKSEYQVLALAPTCVLEYSTILMPECNFLTCANSSVLEIQSYFKSRKGIIRVNGPQTRPTQEVIWEQMLFLTATATSACGFGFGIHLIGRLDDGVRPPILLAWNSAKLRSG